MHASRDPWIAEQVAFLRAAHDAGVPSSGSASAARRWRPPSGATVSRAPQTEIGWIDVDGEDGYGGRWFTWHEDVFDLPPGATELARAASGTQAFAVGASVGLQFHPEVTPAIVEDWLDGRAGAVADPEPMRSETTGTVAAARERAFALMDRIAARWPR